jgi:hypothetical protein
MRPFGATLCAMPRDLGQHDEEQQPGDTPADLQKDESHESSSWKSLSCVLAAGGRLPGVIRFVNHIGANGGRRCLVEDLAVASAGSCAAGNCARPSSLNTNTRLTLWVFAEVAALGYLDGCIQLQQAKVPRHMDLETHNPFTRIAGES